MDFLSLLLCILGFIRVQRWHDILILLDAHQDRENAEYPEECSWEKAGRLILILGSGCPFMLRIRLTAWQVDVYKLSEAS